MYIKCCFLLLYFLIVHGLTEEEPLNCGQMKQTQTETQLSDGT